VERIKEAAGCQPYCLQLLCHRLYGSDHSLRPLTESELEVDDLLGSLFRSDYQNLLVEEKELLWRIVDRGDEGMSTPQMSTALDASDLATCLYWLACLGYIRRRRGRVFIANRLLASWLYSHREELRGVGGEGVGSGTVSPSRS